MGYRISVALAGLSLVLAVTGWILLPISWESVKNASSDSMQFETLAWIAVFLVAPLVLPLALWRWSAPAARILIPALAFLYCVWVVLWATALIGLLFWPAGLVLLLASLIRAAVGLPGRGPTGPMTALTAADILDKNEDGTWGAAKRRHPNGDVLAFLRGDD